MRPQDVRHALMADPVTFRPYRVGNGPSAAFPAPVARLKPHTHANGGDARKDRSHTVRFGGKFHGLIERIGGRCATQVSHHRWLCGLGQPGDKPGPAND
jgi:hypothetical protein